MSTAGHMPFLYPSSLEFSGDVRRTLAQIIVQLYHWRLFERFLKWKCVLDVFMTLEQDGSSKQPAVWHRTYAETFWNYSRNGEQRYGWCRGLAHREGSRHPWQPCSKRSNAHQIWRWRKHWKYSNSFPRRVTSGCTECNNWPTNQPSCRNFEDQQPPQHGPPLSLMNEKQLTAYSIDLINSKNYFWTTKEKW